MFCSNCGKPINDGAEFCPFCGNATSYAKPAIDTNHQAPIQNIASDNITLNASKNEKFWKFIWCDLLYILIILELFLWFTYMLSSPEFNFFSISPIFAVLLNIVTLVLWNKNINKPALILLIVDMFALPVLLAIPGMVLFVLNGYCLVRVLKEVKGQFHNPYTSKDFVIELTKIKKAHMILVIAAFVIFIISTFLPAYRYTGSIGNASTYADTVSLLECFGGEDGTWIYPLPFFSMLICLLYLRKSNIAYVLPLLVNMFFLGKLVYILNTGISVQNFTIGDAVVASAGKHGGLGFYLLIISLLCDLAAIVVLFFKDKKRN